MASPVRFREKEAKERQLRLQPRRSCWKIWSGSEVALPPMLLIHVAQYRQNYEARIRRLNGVCDDSHAACLSQSSSNSWLRPRLVGRGSARAAARDVMGPRHICPGRASLIGLVDLRGSAALSALRYFGGTLPRPRLRGEIQRIPTLKSFSRSLGVPNSHRSELKAWSELNVRTHHCLAARAAAAACLCSRVCPWALGASC